VYRQRIARERAGDTRGKKGESDFAEKRVKATIADLGISEEE